MLLTHTSHTHSSSCAPPQEFLNDYGMVWVGTDGEQREVKGHNEGVWLPDSSVTHKPFAVDFDLLVKNIKVNKNNAQGGEPGNKVIVLSVCVSAAGSEYPGR